MASKEPAIKTYVLELKNGDIRKITVPAHWKLTFGNVLPYEGKGARTGEARIALRLYENSKENLRAVYMDVVSFRDSSIETLERRTSTQRKSHVERTEAGARDVEVVATMTEWVNPDQDPSTVPAKFKQIGRTPGEDDE